MGYSNKQEVILAIANALSEGNPAGPGVLMPITSIGQSITDTLPESQIYQYIRWADMNIDAALSDIYMIPLKRVNLGTFSLAMDVTAGDTYILVQDNTRFIEDDVILIRNTITSQEVTVLGMPDQYRIDLTGPVTNSYLSVDATVEKIGYPDPIPKVSARLAAAHIFDKHFAAQVEGNQSDFGKLLMTWAYNDLNQVLAGTILLKVPDATMYTGRRFYNAALDDAYGTRAEAGKEWFKTT